METLGQELETMRRVPLAPAHVDAICAIGRELTYPAGSIVMDIGEPLDRFVYVVEGEIEVVDPYTGWLSGLAATDAKGFAITGAGAGQADDYATTAPGIFAVGDVRAGSVKRVASAVGEGSVVVSRIWQYLEDTRAKPG